MISHAFVVDFDPVAFYLFGRPAHWYGLSYLFAIFVGWLLGRLRTWQYPGRGFTAKQVDAFACCIGFGVVLGGRIGYKLVYEPFLPGWQASHLWEIGKGGMSFHGGLIGAMAALWFAKRHVGRFYMEVLDFIAPLAPLGVGAVRIGNFINGELWGKATNLPWGMIFPGARDGMPRHPSPLYEFFFEGLVLFAVIWWFSSKSRPTMAVSGLFMTLYGTFRILIEFVRVPDKDPGYLAFGWVTMGQLLTLPVLALGVLWLWMAYGRRDHQGPRHRTHRHHQ